MRARARIQLGKLSHCPSTSSTMAATMPSTPSGELEQPRSRGEDFQQQLLLLKRKRRRNRSERKKETTVIDRNDIHVVRVDAFSDIRVGNDDSSTPREACVGEEFGGRGIGENLQEKHRKCEELIQSNDDLRCMHREVSKELAKLKRFISSQGIGISSMRSAAAVAADEDDDNDEDSRSYLFRFLRS